MSPGQHQNRANKSQGIMSQAGWRAQEVKQGAGLEDWCYRNECVAREWRGRRYDGEQGKGRSEGRANGEEEGW